MESVNSEIAAKIKKLLALSQSDNSNEAALAAERARELLEKYNMSLTDVEIQTSEMTEDKFNLYHSGVHKNKIRKQMTPWIYDLGRVIRNYFHVKPLYCDNGTICLLGAKVDVEIGKYIFIYLANETDRLANKEIENFKLDFQEEYGYNPDMHDLMEFRRSYSNGVIAGVRHKLENERSSREAAKTSSGTDLVVVKNAAVEKYVTSKYPSLRSIKSRTTLGRSSDATRSGFEAGKNISIHRGVGGSRSQKRLT